MAETGKTRKATNSMRREHSEYYHASDEEIRDLARAGFRVISSRVKMLPL